MTLTLPRVTVTRPQRQEKPLPLPAAYRWRLRGLAANVTFTDTDVTAWFRWKPTPWDFLSNADCERRLDQLVAAHVALAGREFHERSFVIPYPAAAWAASLDQSTPHPVEAKAWAEYLRATQEHLRGSTPAVEPVVFLGVTLTAPTLASRAVDWKRHGSDPQARASAAAGRSARELADLTTHLAEVAEPATQKELEGLLHRSRGLCLPPPLATQIAGTVPLDAADLAGIYESVDVDPGPLGSRSLRVVGAPGRNGAAPVVRHVVLASVGQMGDQLIPEKHHPWAALLLQTLGVELSRRGRVLSGPDAQKAISKKIDQILDQRAQRDRHGLLTPPHEERLIAHAVAVQDEMTHAHESDATRVRGWHRVAVPGRTPDEAWERFLALRTRMAKQQIAVEVVRAQEGVYREFTPGEPLATTAHKRNLKVRLHAAAVPQVSSTVGDRQGLHFGTTVGVTRTPFTWDLHLGMEERDQSGLTPVPGSLGSGKSFLINAACALSALRGQSVTMLDPAGQSQAVAQWAPIAKRATVVDALKEAFSPFGVIPFRHWKQYLDHPDVLSAPAQDRSTVARGMAAEAERNATYERRALALDCLRRAIPVELRKHPETEPALMAAVRSTGGAFTASLMDCVEHLERRGREGERHHRLLAEVLREVSEHPRAAGWFRAAYDQHTSVVDATLLVVSLAGLRLPGLGTDESTWDVSERLSLPLMLLAAHYVESRIYRMAREERKVIAFDEAHYFAGWASGRSLMARIERESRRWNTRAFVGSQDWQTTLQAQQASKALFSDVIVGHSSDSDEQLAGARLLGVPEGYAPTIGTLRPMDDEVLAEGQKWRHFLVRINGKVGRVHVDLPATPDLRALLVTSPKRPGASPADAAARAGEWFE